jgi:hypothetical protein
MRRILAPLAALAITASAPAAFGAFADCGASVAPTLVPAGDITANTTWSGVVVLQGPVFVKNGATLTILAGTIVRGQPRQAAVLAGRQAGTPGAVFVTRDGRIVANGSATNPIVFTTAATDNNNDGIADDTVTLDLTQNPPVFVAGADGLRDPWEPGDTFLDDTCSTAPLAPLDRAGKANVQLWGGLVIMGNAPTNLADKYFGTAEWGVGQVEGLTIPGFPAADAKYGGVLPHDNSGSLRFVSVRYAGDLLGSNNELNGLTLAGVGDGTTIEYYEVFSNFDDGIEWFGGTVNPNHLVVSFAGDDTFDIDQGYTGTLQFLLGIQPFFNLADGTGAVFADQSGDKLGEFDGDDYRPDDAALNGNVTGRMNVNAVATETPTPAPWPLSGFAIYNATWIGTNLDSADNPGGTHNFLPPGNELAADNLGVQWRNGGAGDVFNSVIVNTGSNTALNLQTALGSGAPGFDAADNACAGLINLACSTVDDGPVFPAAGSCTPHTSVSIQNIVNNGDALEDSLRGAAPVATDNNAINPANFALVNDDISFDPQGNAAGKITGALKPNKLDPRAQAIFGSPTAGCVAPRGTGLDAAAVYRGAFPFGTPLWINGWTALSQAGLTASN